MKIISLNLLLIVSVLFSACQTSKEKETVFVKVKSLSFYKGEKPYYFMGTNFWYGAYLGSKASYGSRERLTRELDQLSALGVKNLRILAASENSEISNSLKPAFIISPGKYDKDLLDGLDFLMCEMSKRGMYGVLFLNNFWEWSGGMGQYLAWANGGKIVDPVKGKDSWSDFMKNSSLFYSDTLANRYYHDYIKMLVNRVNTYTGRLYKDDPAIMAWELANEPRGGEGSRTAEADTQFCSWVDKTAGFIHSLDQNHLVTTGSEGIVGCKHDSLFFKQSHGSKNIDYLTFHLWAKNWSWFDAKNIAGTFPSTKIKAIAYVNAHMVLARSLGKPIVMEEFGMERDSSKCTTGSPVTARDNYYSTLFALMLDTASAHGPFAGCNFWAWGGEGRPASADFIYKFGDPFTGDPPQEGQGLNSIYNSDSSTLNIIKKYSAEMDKLCN
jgi:mannan endo-1,4-beta-mannosidase